MQTPITTYLVLDNLLLKTALGLFLKMETLVRLLECVWEKTMNFEWCFDENPADQGETARSWGSHSSGLNISTSLDVEGPRTPPITLSSDEDVGVMLSVRWYMAEAVLYVTSGPQLVAKYNFLHRSPFTICDKTFLGEGITEEQHQQAIRELVCGQPIVCSKNMLEIMFSEPQLLIVYRVALEIEMIYAPSHAERDEY
ncbi:unnamed protein product [Eruca vesicaria subsp. sativa]|uniref:Uncharacterized protein n=1 Tax=Eruca vesicaria subsp. sativa TaxID=29727 RepID=A0ABC8LX28_ERUVS|nr:unnamed protein product [Eruca vesicaria subsp. sativa]